jgi:hypothetical protein
MADTVSGKTSGTLSSMVAAALLALAPAFVHAQTPVALTIAGNEARGEISLPGNVTADLVIAFEQVVGLNPAALDVSVQLVSPLDPGLAARLPQGPGLFGGTVPKANLLAAFPVLLRIDPSAGSALSFSGVVSVQLHTHVLHLDLAAPFVLFSAHGGGPFRDITKMVAVGSYRVGGSSGGFSEFLVVLDLRPGAAVVTAKYDALQADLAAHASNMDPDVASDLSARLSASRAHWSAGAAVPAIAELDGFSQAVQAASGAAIPDVWRAHDPRVNVAGTLRAGADTLRFSLLRQTGP